jgi:hypothetical protein
MMMRPHTIDRVVLALLVLAVLMMLAVLLWPVPASAADGPRTAATLLVVSPAERAVTAADLEPVLVRISAAKRMRDRAEQDARAAGVQQVDLERLERLFGRSKAGQPA